jgi:hypothetical protein
MVYIKITHRKLKIEQQKRTKYCRSTQVLRKDSSSCSTSDTRHVTAKRHVRHAMWKLC